MDHPIRLSIEDCRAFLGTYVQQTPAAAHMLFFDPQKSTAANLRQLSVQALHPHHTLGALYAFEPVFLDSICRWIDDPLVEEEYCTLYDHPEPSVSGVFVVSALARLAGVHPESLNLVELYISSTRFFEQLRNSTQTNMAELELVLLAFWRLLSHDCARFKGFVDPGILHRITAIEDPSGLVSRYLACSILCRYHNASEKVENATLGKVAEPVGTYEGDKDINFRHLALLEAKRLSNYANLPERTHSGTAGIDIHQGDLAKTVHLVGGKLVPRNSTAHDDATDPTFVPTPEALRVVSTVTSLLLQNKPVMLHGAAGSGKTYLINQLARSMGFHDSIVKVHLGDQTDAKVLLGTYTSGSTPGSFEWRAGVLTTAVREGKWLLIEDIDRAPTEVLSVLLPLLENRKLSIPSRGEIVRAANGFQIIATVRTSDKIQVPDMIGIRNWALVGVEAPSGANLRAIIQKKYPRLADLVPQLMRAFAAVVQVNATNSFISLNRGSHPRVVSIRDLMKLCARCNHILSRQSQSNPEVLEAATYDNIFAEVVDCFGSALTDPRAMEPIVNAVGTVFEIPTSRINLFLAKHVPAFALTDEHLAVGRAFLPRKTGTRAARSANATSFARTNHSLRLMEQIGAAVLMAEPVLLVGETGTGKTTIVQQMAKLTNQKITVINVSQQTESSDLLGGYKPVTTRTMALPHQETFDELFSATFSTKKNERFVAVLGKCFAKGQWKNVVRLWLESVKMARAVLGSAAPDHDETPKKKRRVGPSDKQSLLARWAEFEQTAQAFQHKAQALEDAFVFDFVEGALVKAVRNGEWLLLDEINLAAPDTLESIADLVTDQLAERLLLLAEKGDISAVAAHHDFRLFACMNPSTDIGKRDLPVSIRSRFSEIYVHSPDGDIQDLLAIIDKYVGRYAVGDEWLGNDIAELYLGAKRLAETNQIVDGANQRPHFSIRTLTRTLLYVADIVAIYGVRRALFEGFCMSFLTLLDGRSEATLLPLIRQYTVDKLKNASSVMKQSPPDPSTPAQQYVQFKHYWLARGGFEVVPQPHYIITPFVEKNILNLVRATSGKRFPVLIQGPTSAGKTSMIQYLAGISGHKFVRINNHEHTDLQEYLGSYVAVDGRLVFKEGVLVEALKHGHWIVLDELNLAPTDVLEALNRLLDDNRELLIPETQEVVHPHPDFMLFATQNPPGLYGGRKLLSRAFKNRFLELHFDDIPQDELETILTQRCRIAPSYSRKIVEVYRQLSVQRQSTRLFEQKNSFATLRDLFRWALRGAVGYDELAAHGYMILAERVRVPAERRTVQRVLEAVMRVRLDMDAFYARLENRALVDSDSPVVWTRAMRRLAVLVATSMQHNEPLLLVGETGCGKTTVCQTVARFHGQRLVTVNAHQNTETSDLLGAQRPVRNKNATRTALVALVASALGSPAPAPVDALLAAYDALPPDAVAPATAAEVRRLRHQLAHLFEWSDGPLVQAMKSGDVFLLDEISLADDSVLERLNSVLEPERSLLLAEKGAGATPLTAAPGFQFLATMNPGGDYGKKELSPALRNRFTEIWVPSMEDPADTRHIVAARLAPPCRHLAPAIVDFSGWFAATFGGSVSAGAVSLRDILAWVEFVNCADMDPHAALYHGALMVFVDALGTNNTAHLAASEHRLAHQKQACVHKLAALAGGAFAADAAAVETGPATLRIGRFAIPTRGAAAPAEPFALHAPTTALNAMRVLRGMQVHKPILLEGSPGVGKTSLVAALAQASGNPLVRINLSEQTDLVDLFGSDVPAEGGRAGEFVWRDAPFLRAMKRGEWVLLDEMNLASQSVLEGLNACLDHRGTAYIPELGRAFPRHANFTVFAAQNPQAQGGGRKGLPKSFVNRFTVVYVDTLKPEDLRLIAGHLYPDIDPAVAAGIIAVVARIEQEVVVDKKWGQSGGPWEFNLRDTLRWLQMYSAATLVHDIAPSDFLDMLVCQRFRTRQDQLRARACFEAEFGAPVPRDNYYRLTESFLQAGGCIHPRCEPVHFRCDDRLLPLQCNFPALQSALRSVVHRLPLILTGPSSSGKTDLVRFLGSVLGHRVEVFAMNSDVDSTDILGGFEQVDLAKTVNTYAAEVAAALDRLVVLSALPLEAKSQVSSLLANIANGHYNTENVAELVSGLEALTSSADVSQLLAHGRAAVHKISLSSGITFEWFDGMLVQAVQNGTWLILDNANLCSPSVLDRLNSLLETNGKLIVNECNNELGEPRVIAPHENFRLFLTTDPKYGELSRAMRNRGVEIYLEPLLERMTSHDRLLLGEEDAKAAKLELEEGVQLLNIGQAKSVPMTKFLSAEHTQLAPLAHLHDLATAGTLTSVSLGTLSAQAAASLATVQQTIEASSLFDEPFKASLQSAIDQYALVEEIGAPRQLSLRWSSIEADIVAKGLAAPSFAEFQALSPLLNAYVQRDMGFGTEAVYLFEAASELQQAQSFLRGVLRSATNKNAKDLSFLEKSAAVALGRSLKSPPKLQIFRLMKELLAFAYDTLKQESAHLFQNTTVNKTVFEFLILWSSLAATASGTQKARFPVYKELFQEWIKGAVSDLWSPDNLQQLTHTLQEFEKDINMTTGLSMEIVWQGARANYPVSQDSWEKCLQIVEIAKHFDKLSQTHALSSQVHDLSRLLREVFYDVSSSTIPDSEFNELCTLLLGGVQRIQAASDKSAESQRFAVEYRLLYNFVVAQRKPVSTVAQLAPMAQVPTIEAFAFPRDGKMPYPSVFNTFWNLDSSESFVEGMFSDNYVRELSGKIVNMPKCSGKLLDGTHDQLVALRKHSIEHSRSILNDKIELFLSVLLEWYAHILELHRDVFSKPTMELLQRLPQEHLNEAEREQLTSHELLFVEVVSNFFGPAVRAAQSAAHQTNPSLTALGKAWVLFACGCIQLYVPSSPFDPAQKEHIVYDYLSHQQKVVGELRDLWENLRVESYGDEPIIAESYVPQENSQLVKPQVFRFDLSSDQLFEEWDSFMKSSIGAASVLSLYESAQNDHSKFLKMASLFQNNSARFLVRLRDSFTVFADLNDLLRGYVCGLKLGFELLTIEANNAQCPVPSLAWTANLNALVSTENIGNSFASLRPFLKLEKPDSFLPEKTMKFFLKLCYTQKGCGRAKQVDTVLQDSYQFLYYRWTLRRLKEEEEQMQNSSLFKYADETADIGDDFRNLFPDHEDVLDADHEVKKTNESFDELYHQISRDYMDAFSPEPTLNQFDLQQLVHEGSVLREEFSNVAAGHHIEAGAFTALMVQMSGAISSVQNRDEKVDFYHGFSTFEFKRALDVVNRIAGATAKLLAEWPEHLTLQCIARCCTEFANFPIEYSVSRLLQKVEQIYAYLVEWEKYAHSGVSFSTLVAQIVELIISWRKLELQTWTSLFAHETKSLERTMGKWWFYLFEVLLVPVFGTDKVDDETCVKIVAALNTFLGQTSYGEFGIRLRLIRGFKNHILAMNPTSKVGAALSNVLDFFGQFLPVVESAISDKRKSLDKEMSEVILLARWKDVNPDALKQSARKSHNSLYKIVRKYRAVLASQMSTLVQLGLPVDSSFTMEPFSEHRKSPNLFYDSILTNIDTWQQRPTRFRKLDRVLENMDRYINTILSQSYPSLWEYTHSLLGEMERLRKETPKTLTKENKKVIAALKAQKTKLMSDTITDLKNMGVRLAIQTKVVLAQATTSLVLATSSSFSATTFDGIDQYYFRVLDLLPRLRAAVAECNEEVPLVSVEKCMGSLENLIFTSTATRKPLYRFSTALKSITNAVCDLENVALAFETKTPIVRTTRTDSLRINIESNAFNLDWFARFVSLISLLNLEEVQTHALFVSQLSVLGLAASTLAAEKPLEAVLTENSSQWINKCLEFESEALYKLQDLEHTSPQLAFVTATLAKLLQKEHVIESSTSLTTVVSLEEIERSFRSLSSAILIAVQNVKENNDQFNTETDAWFQESQTNLFEGLKRLNSALIAKHLNRCLCVISKHEYNETASLIISALVRFTMPLLQHYENLINSFFGKARQNYFENTRSVFMLATSLHSIAVNGFCSPQAEQEQKQDENLQDGTGLGDGSGAADSTKDIDEEDLAEAAQEENKEKDDGDSMDEEQDNAHDIEGDMAGDLEEAEDEKDDEEGDENEDLDEEIDNLDDVDPNAVDEKMWDEQVEDDKMKEKESNEVPDNKEENLEGNDEAGEDESKEKNTEDEGKDGEEKDDGDEGEEGEEEDQLGEQEDEVKHDDEEGEALDEHVPESEVLDIPEDMNLDSDGEEEEEKGDNFDLDDMEEKEETNEGDGEMDDKSAEDGEMEEDEDTKEDEEMDVEGADDMETNEEGDAENGENEDQPQEENSDAEELKNDHVDEDSKADSASKLEAEGNDGADNENTEEMNTDVKQERGQRGQGDDNEDAEENEDVGAAGGASVQPDQNEATGEDEAQQQISESLKQLGDSLKEFHRRRQEIKEASERDEQANEAANENPEEFEHVEGENAKHDTQAMGAADREQTQKIDDDMAIDHEDETEVEVKDEAKPEDEPGEPANTEDVEMGEQTRNDDSVDARVHLQFGKQAEELDNQVKIEDMENEEADLEPDMAPETTGEAAPQVPAMDSETAHDLWAASEQATQELASGLCEQLRLILEPTMSTKLRGDYKTGKRLNMKRIIPYIASDFRKDKIWLRRTKPSKRQYQIMIAVDDSKSMSESSSHELAFHSIALVSKALTQLESGELSIVRFGEDVKVVHPFEKPFNLRESGPLVFQWFDFQQTRTDVKQLCSTTLDLFDRARASSSADIWQLQIIISDGVCEDHETLLRLVREARDKKVMLVFVVLDGINQKESILDMSQVTYLPDGHGGTSLKVSKYLDSFPFEFYVVVKDIHELPQMLSLILRQYFSEISSI